MRHFHLLNVKIAFETVNLLKSIADGAAGGPCSYPSRSSRPARNRRSLSFTASAIALAYAPRAACT